jgi:enterochelin esterase-like enzyme
MNRLIFFILFSCFGFSVAGQSSSEYYQASIDTVVKSKFLNENKKITVILPRSFNKSKATKFPLIIVFDRQNKKIFRQIYESINYLVSFSEMPESVIVGVTTDDNKRTYETLLSASSKNGYGEKNDDFIFNELIPFVKKEYNVNDCKVLIGHSRYGYFTSYLLAKHLSDLTAVISCSPFFLEPNVNLVDSLKNKLLKEPLKHPFYYRIIYGDTATETNQLAEIKNFLNEANLPQYFNWKDLSFSKANHMAAPGLGVMPSLLDIFDYWSIESKKVLSENKIDFDQIEYEAFLQKMTTHYGDKIGLGISELNGIGYKYYNEQKYSEARKAWNILLEEYPTFSYTFLSIGKSYMKENDNQNAVIFFEKAKQNLINNSFYSESEKEEILQEVKELMKSSQ